MLFAESTIFMFLCVCVNKLEELVLLNLNVDNEITVNKNFSNQKSGKK